MSSANLGLIALALFGTLAIGALLLVRHRDQKRRDAGRRVFMVRFPRTVTADQVRAFLASLTGLASPGVELAGRDAAVFEVIGTGRGVSLRLSWVWCVTRG